MSKKPFNNYDPSIFEEIRRGLSDFDKTFARVELDNIFNSFYLPHPYMYEWEITLRCLLVFLILDIPFVAIKVLSKRISQRVNYLRRKKYHILENEKRRLLRAERRKIRKRYTLNKCPTPKQFLEAWLKSKTSLAGMLHFGGMVHDLACYVDSSLRFNKSRTRITGRNGGIKAWIRENLPDLLPKYQTIMRYHAAAVKVRQHTQIHDPMPTAMIDDTIEERQTWTTEEILEYSARSCTSIMEVMEKSLRHRYMPDKDLIAASTVKWANKAGFKRESKDDKQIQKHFDHSINEALKFLRKAIESHVTDYLKEVKATIQESLKNARKVSRETTKFVNGRIKRIKTESTLKITRKPLSTKIKKWRECKSWLFAVLDEREMILDEVTGKVARR